MAVDDDLVAAPAWPELLPWQQTAATEALTARASWPHALLISGPRGIGKRTLAQNFARSLLCGHRARMVRLRRVQLPVRYAPASDLQLVDRSASKTTATSSRSMPFQSTIRALIDWALVTSHRGQASRHRRPRRVAERRGSRRC
jgi:hypothetical protein